jgi:hypothetical protein
MSSSDNERLLHEVSVRALALRDVLAHLLAHESKKLADPTIMYEKISNAVGTKAKGATETEPLNDPTAIAFQEMIQREVDEIVGMARLIVQKDSRE